MFRSIRLFSIFVALSGFIANGQNDRFAWESASPTSQGVDAGLLESARAGLVARGTKALLVIRNDRIILEWYAADHGPDQRHYSASLAKALVGGLSLALSLQDGHLRLDDKASAHIEAWRDDSYKGAITIRQLATHCSGLEDAEDAENETPHDRLTGWKGAFWKRHGAGEDLGLRDPFSLAIHQAPVLFEPGSDFAYSNPGMAALAYAVTKSLAGSPHADLRSLLRARIMEPLGIEGSDWQIGYGRRFEVDGLPLVANWGGGAFTARAVARIGRLILRRGDWEGSQLLEPQWVEAMTRYGGTALPPRPPENPFPAPALGWYDNSDGVWPDVPRDTVVGAGAGGQVLAVIPCLDMIVVRNGSLLGDPRKGEGFWKGVETRLLAPLTKACVEANAKPAGAAPYPPSARVHHVDWSPLRDVGRAAPGGDNWPITWAGDGHQYTAWGDGKGFRPFTERKSSMGFARVEGGPDDFRGVNIRSATGEAFGDGPAGKKASGLLALDGTLYVWARNADNSQLGWSNDHGATWEWSDWRFETSFGAPVFLNAGQDYGLRRDAYAYIYSFDSEDAYTAADRMVLARVAVDRLRTREAYTFFVRRTEAGAAEWSPRIEERGSVFDHPGQCYRSGITFHPILERYLWVQIHPGAPRRAERTRDKDPRFRGGFGIYDAPEPWGPWTTVYFTPLWDTGPGESASMAAKWIESDEIFHLVFSGEDHFSVRRGRFVLR